MVGKNQPMAEFEVTSCLNDARAGMQNKAGLPSSEDPRGRFLPDALPSPVRLGSNDAQKCCREEMLALQVIYGYVSPPLRQETYANNGRTHDCTDKEQEARCVGR